MPSQSFNIFSSDFSNEYSLLAAPLRFRTYKIKVQQQPNDFYLFFFPPLLEQHCFLGGKSSPLGDQKKIKKSIASHTKPSILACNCEELST
jgi:hypothetical protein